MPSGNGISKHISPSWSFLLLFFCRKKEQITILFSCFYNYYWLYSIFTYISLFNYAHVRWILMIYFLHFLRMRMQQQCWIKYTKYLDWTSKVSSRKGFTTASPIALLVSETHVFQRGGCIVDPDNTYIWI